MMEEGNSTMIHCKNFCKLKKKRNNRGKGKKETNSKAKQGPSAVQLPCKDRRLCPLQSHFASVDWAFLPWTGPSFYLWTGPSFLHVHWLVQ
jgi:hypothetical protein